MEEFSTSWMCPKCLRHHGSQDAYYSEPVPMKLIQIIGPMYTLIVTCRACGYQTTMKTADYPKLTEIVD